MPFVMTKTNLPISRKQELELKARLGEAIALIPGKSEAYLLLSFEDNCRLWLGGMEDEAVAYIEASVFGSESHIGYDAFSCEVTRIFCQVLGIPSDHIYIKFTDIPIWSVGGMSFDRRQFR